MQIQSGSTKARRVRAAIASLATLVLVATGLVVVAAPAQAAGETNGSVAGIVFQDFTSDGWYTTGAAAAGVPRNRPVAGVTVKAFDAEGDLVGTAASAADGTYTLAVSGAFSGTCGWSSPAGARVRARLRGTGNCAPDDPGRQQHERPARDAGCRGLGDRRRLRSRHPRPGHPARRADRDRHPVCGRPELHRARTRRRPSDARRAAVVEDRQR